MARPSPKVTWPAATEGGHSVVLRAGATSDRLFMFPGAGCAWREVAPLAELVDAPWSVIGIESWRPISPSTVPPRNVEEMALVARQAIQAAQPRGPYALAGYSLGGLVALETADLLARSGEPIQLLALIDGQVHPRFWPFRQRLRGRLKRLVRIAKMPAKVRFAKVRQSLKRASIRLARRSRGETAAPPTLLQRCDAAYGMYQPRPYAGRVVLIGPDRSAELGVDFAELWRNYAKDVAAIRVPGGHHELMRSRPRIRGVAHALNDALRHERRSSAADTPV